MIDVILRSIFTPHVMGPLLHGLFHTLTRPEVSKRAGDAVSQAVKRAAAYVKSLLNRLKKWASDYISEHPAVETVYINAINMVAALKRAKQTGKRFFEMGISAKEAGSRSPRVIRYENVDISNSGEILENVNEDIVLAINMAYSSPTSSFYSYHNDNLGDMAQCTYGESQQVAAESDPWYYDNSGMDYSVDSFSRGKVTSGDYYRNNGYIPFSIDFRGGGYAGYVMQIKNNSANMIRLRIESSCPWDPQCISYSFPVGAWETEEIGRTWDKPMISRNFKCGETGSIWLIDNPNVGCQFTINSSGQFKLEELDRI